MIGWNIFHYIDEKLENKPDGMTVSWIMKV